MSDTNEINRPTHLVYQVIGEGEKSTWLRIGAAWMHKDTRGANIVLNAMPLTGRIVMRERNEQVGTAAQADAQGGQQ